MRTTFLIILAFLIGLTACNKDDPEPPGPNCETTCQNGGTVTSDCGCDCPAGFNGTMCQHQQVPDRFIVTSIRLTGWEIHPDNGGNWDTGNGRPDIYFRFWYSSSIVHAQTGYIADCIPNTDYTYSSPGFPFYMDCGRTYPLQIFDEDGSYDQLMLNSYGIDIADFSNGLPTAIPVHSGDYSFQLIGYWQF